MKRRDAIAALLALGTAVGPRRLIAQQARRAPARVGLLSNFSPASGKEVTECFLHGLRDLGWTEKRNLQIEYRFADGIADRYAPLAAELVGLRPDLIVVMGTPASQAVHRATSTIPVVMISVSDPVASSIVAGLAKPGGNVTGVSNFLPATTGKLLEFLRIVAPRASTVGVLYNPTNPGKVLEIQELRTAANRVGVALQLAEVRSASDFEGAFSRIVKARCGALITLQEGVALENKSRIVEFARRSRLPTIFQIREYVDAGGLMSYGLNFCQHFRSAAPYVDKILRGARPGDLPIELPTSFELLVNLRTAKAIGLEIPQALLARADEVIK